MSVALSTVPNFAAVPSKVITGMALGSPINVMKGLFLSMVTFSLYSPGAILMITRFVFAAGTLFIASVGVLNSPPLDPPAITLFQNFVIKLLFHGLVIVFGDILSLFHTVMVRGSASAATRAGSRPLREGKGATLVLNHCST